MIAAGLDAQVNHVFFNPASLFMAAVGFGLLYGSLPRPVAACRISACALWRWPVTPMLCGIGALALASFPLRWVISEHYVAEARRLGTARPPPSPRHIHYAWHTAWKWSPDNVNAIYGLASMAYNDERLAEAEKTLRDYLKLSPYHSPALNLLATVQARAGRLDDAESTLREALRLEPGAATIKENIEQIKQLRQKQNAGPLPDDKAKDSLR
jgi:tetratricopeptide (TPR) repeat protein